jgi:hypothetical protein
LPHFFDDLGSQTSQIDRAQAIGWLMFSQTAADDVFFNKGLMYAYGIILASLW